MQAGLKTGMYYLRTRAAADAIKFTVDQQALAKNRAAKAAKLAAVLPASAIPSGLKVQSHQHLDGIVAGQSPLSLKPFLLLLRRSNAEMDSPKECLQRKNGNCCFLFKQRH